MSDKNRKICPTELWICPTKIMKQVKIILCPTDLDVSTKLQNKAFRFQMAVKNVVGLTLRGLQVHDVCALICAVFRKTQTKTTSNRTYLADISCGFFMCVAHI